MIERGELSVNKLQFLGLLVCADPWVLPSHPPSAGAPPEGKPFVPWFEKNSFLISFSKGSPFGGAPRSGERAIARANNVGKAQTNIPTKPNLGKIKKNREEEVL